MTAKEYLNQARTLDRERRVKETEVENLKKDVQALNSPSFGERVVGSHENKSMSDVDKIVDMEAEIKSEINILIDLKREIRGKIGQLKKAEHRIVLTEYYINIKEWKDVAVDNVYSERQTYRIHGAALNEFRKVFDMK